CSSTSCSRSPSGARIWSSTSPIVSATTGGTPLTPPRAARCDGRANARSTRHWRRPSSGTGRIAGGGNRSRSTHEVFGMKVLVTGAGGQVGTELVEALSPHQVIACTHADLDAGDRDSALAAITGTRPDAIVHCAAWTNVDGCETDANRAYRDNALACRNIMEAARRVDAYVVSLSTDYVFDGEK